MASCLAAMEIACLPMLLKLKRTPGIYLVGFMASGKTTIGRMLADELGWSFADMDEDIEAAEGVSIAKIFDTRGEEEFRRIEQAALRQRVSEVERGKPMVLALGGGAFVQESSHDILEDNGVTIWLDCPFETVCSRVGETADRPLARDPARFRQLYEDRRAAYAKADYRIEVSSDDPVVMVAAIMKLPIF
ncbi:MAG TPA: shikimate kinase [Bryobacteraceae bacterium]|nr:shikimate kinase [Bryobacteraceae bacterium]